MGQAESKVGVHSGAKCILILGCEEAGKTCLSLRFMQHLGESVPTKELSSYKRLIQKSVVRMYKQTLSRINVEKFKTRESGKFKYFRIVQEQDEKAEVFPDILIESMKQLAECMTYREHEKHPFFRHYSLSLDRILSSSYRPSFDDMATCYRPTDDIRETIVEEAPGRRAVKIVEIAGSRYARRRWIQSLEKFDAVIFIASALHNQLSKEFEESLTYFETICNSRLFGSSAIALVFTKVDLLEANNGKDYKNVIDSLKCRYFEVADRVTPVFETILSNEKRSRALVQLLLK